MNHSKIDYEIMKSRILDDKYSHMLYICKSHAQKHGVTKTSPKPWQYFKLHLSVIWILLSEI